MDFLRGLRTAVEFVQNNVNEIGVSVITIAELYAGVREGDERKTVDGFINTLESISLTQQIARQAGLYRRDFGKTHGTGLADAIIAATSELHEYTLVTLNKKHYPMLDEVLMPYQKR